MEIDEFADITQNVIAESGFDDFQPTACFPDRRELRTLADFPEEEDPERSVLDWAAEIAGGANEYLVAFKIDALHFKVIRKLGINTFSGTFAVAQQTAARDHAKRGG